MHEAAHLDLIIKQSLDPILKNGKDFVVSPFRRGKRPLIALLHAVYVLKRAVHLMSKLLECRILNDQEANRATEILRDYRKKFEFGYSTLMEFAEPTPAGEVLIRSLCPESPWAVE